MAENEGKRKPPHDGKLATYFMRAAVLASMRSKDPVTQVGACIVNDEEKIIGVGYNGMPTGCHDDFFSWGKKEDNKNLYVCHAEMNAIIYKNAPDVKNCTIYVSLYPCNQCAKVIIESGIKDVVYLSNKNYKKTEASTDMFHKANIYPHPYNGNREPIDINFETIKKGLENPSIS